MDWCGSHRRTLIRFANSHPIGKVFTKKLLGFCRNLTSDATESGEGVQIAQLSGPPICSLYIKRVLQWSVLHSTLALALVMLRCVCVSETVACSDNAKIVKKRQLNRLLCSDIRLERRMMSQHPKRHGSWRATQYLHPDSRSSLTDGAAIHDTCAC